MYPLARPAWRARIARNLLLPRLIRGSRGHIQGISWAYPGHIHDTDSQDDCEQPLILSPLDPILRCDENPPNECPLLPVGAGPVIRGRHLVGDPTAPAWDCLGSRNNGPRGMSTSTRAGICWVYVCSSGHGKFLARCRKANGIRVKRPG